MNTVRTDSEGGGGASRGKAHGGSKECYLLTFLGGSQKRLICICCVDKRSGTLI